MLSFGSTCRCIPPDLGVHQETNGNAVDEGKEETILKTQARGYLHTNPLRYAVFLFASRNLGTCHQD